MSESEELEKRITKLEEKIVTKRLEKLEIDTFNMRVDKLNKYLIQKIKRFFRR